MYAIRSYYDKYKVVGHAAVTLRFFYIAPAAEARTFTLGLLSHQYSASYQSVINSHLQLFSDNIDWLGISGLRASNTNSGWNRQRVTFTLPAGRNLRGRFVMADNNAAGDRGAVDDVA